MGELLELVPGEDDVVAVDQQEIVRRAEGFEELALVLAAEHHLRQHIAAADGAVGALKDRQQLLFQLRRAAGGDGAHDALRRRLDRAAEAQQRQVGRVVHVLPLDLVARAVAAEDGARRVFQIPGRVIAGGADERVGLLAGPVAVHAQLQPPAAAGIGRDLVRVAAQQPHRGCSAQDGLRAVGLRRIVVALHPLDVGDRPADAFGRKLQPERIPRLEQHRLRLHQPLPHRTVGRLAEIAALGMLLVRPAGDEREANVRDRRAGQHTAVDLLGQMPEDQPLPVQGQRIGRAHRVELQAGAGLRRLHQQVDLGVVPQRLIMPHALDRGGDGLKIDDIALVEGDLQPEALRDQLLQDLHLHRAHQLHADLAQQRVPDQMQRGILLFQHAELPVGLRGVGPVGQQQAVFQNRLQGRGLRRRLMAEGHAGHRLRQAGHGADRPGWGLLQERKFAAGVQPQLVRLLLPALAREQLLDTQRAARDLQGGQPRALFVPRDLIDARAEVLSIRGHLHEAAQRVQQRVHALLLQSRTKEARKHLPVRDGGRDLRVRDRAGGEIFVEQRIVTERQLL